jgi:PAS domain S-box-containing protein
MLDWSEAELIGEHSHSKIHHSRQDGSPYPIEECPIFNTLKDGKPRSGDNEHFIRKDGTAFPVSYTVSAISDESGRINGAVVSFRDITTQKQAEAELNRNEAIVRFASGLGKLGAWAVSLPDMAVTWSEETGRIFETLEGVLPSVEEGLGRYTPEDRERNRLAFESCITEGTSFDISETRLITFKGNERYVHVMGEPVRNETGEIVGARGAIQDITEQVLAKEALRRSEEKYALATEASQSALWDWDLRTGHLTYSPMYREMLGFDEEEFPDGVDSFNLVEHPDDREHVDQMLSEHIAAKKRDPVSFEFRLKNKAGEYRWMRAVAQAVWDADGNPIRMVGSTSDITERRSAAERTRQSEERFRLLAKATNDAIWDWDLTTDSLWWNDGFETLFGFSRDEIQPTIESRTTRIHPEDREWVVADVRNAIENGEDWWSGEYRFSRKDGTYAYVLDRGYVIRNAGGEPIRMVGGMAELAGIFGYLFHRDPGNGNKRADIRRT